MVLVPAEVDAGSRIGPLVASSLQDERGLVRLGRELEELGEALLPEIIFRALLLLALARLLVLPLLVGRRLEISVALVLVRVDVETFFFLFAVAL